MDETRKDKDAEALADAALVYAVRERVLTAVGQLAACPLDEVAAARMRAALSEATSPAARAALHRLMADGGDRPTMSRRREDGAGRSPTRAGVAPWVVLGGAA